MGLKALSTAGREGEAAFLLFLLIAIGENLGIFPSPPTLPLTPPPPATDTVSLLRGAGAPSDVDTFDFF
jgi:hypothetical protein